VTSIQGGKGRGRVENWIKASRAGGGERTEDTRHQRLDESTSAEHPATREIKPVSFWGAEFCYRLGLFAAQATTAARRCSPRCRTASSTPPRRKPSPGQPHSPAPLSPAQPPASPAPLHPWAPRRVWRCAPNPIDLEHPILHPDLILRCLIETLLKPLLSCVELCCRWGPACGFEGPFSNPCWILRTVLKSLLNVKHPVETPLPGRAARGAAAAAGRRVALVPPPRRPHAGPTTRAGGTGHALRRRAHDERAGCRAAPHRVRETDLACWVTLRARWVTLRARWVTLRACWVTLRARWVTLAG
jgi:hypothetical protein